MRQEAEAGARCNIDLGSGNDPRTTIGSVNFAEFFITLTSAAVFTLLMGTNTWPIIMGLVFGDYSRRYWARCFTR
jgi:hypothetical protein